jgi:hypothetical protein
VLILFLFIELGEGFSVGSVHKGVHQCGKKTKADKDHPDQPVIAAGQEENAADQILGHGRENGVNHTGKTADATSVGSGDAAGVVRLMYFVNPVLNILGYKSFSISYHKNAFVYETDEKESQIFEVKVFSKEHLNRMTGEKLFITFSPHDFSVCYSVSKNRLR